MSYTFSKLAVCITVYGTLLFIPKGTSGQIPPYFTQEPSDIIVQKNRPAVLNCTVQGTPRPKITWYRNGVALLLKNDSRRKVLPDGSLYFAKIVHTKSNRPDEGRYECQVTSRIRNQEYIMISRKAQLKVAGLSSKVTLEPASQQVIFGDIARLHCKIRHSSPKAKITWKFKQKNGTFTVVPSNNKYTLLDNGILQIRNFQQSDAGDYMCTVSNKLVMRTHSSNLGTLTVQTDRGNLRKPEFISSPSDTNSTKGSTVILECAIRGTPKPTVKWFKNSQLITYDSRVKILGESNLEISQVLLDDEGDYKCEGSDGVRVVYKIVKLQVHYPPTFSTKPANKKKHIDDDAKFKCVVEGRPTPNVQWLKNGYLQQTTDFIIIASDSMTVESLLPSDTGIYQCVASNYLGQVQAAAELSVFEKGIPIPTVSTISTTTATTQPSTIQTTTSSPQAPKSRLPSKPENVTTRTLSETEIEVSWDPPLKSNGKMLLYNIFYTYATGGGGVGGLVNTTKQSIVFKNLKPGTKFLFRVYAKNAYGRGPISPFTAGWTAGKPPGMPPSLVAIPTSSSQIKVQWGEPKSEKPITEYVIEYQEIGQSNADKVSTITTNRQKSLKKLKTYTQYSIRVYAVNDNEVKGPPATTMATTFGGVPKGKPRDLVVRGDSTGTELLVTWKPLHHSLVNGRITSYKLEYRKKKRKKIGRVVLKSSPLNYKIKKLNPNTIYEIRMSAGSESGYGDYTHWVQANTSVIACSESSNPGKPTDLQLSIFPSKDRSMIKIEWQAPVDVSQVCVTGYKIEYGEDSPFHQKKRVNATTTHFLAKKGIHSGRKYVVKVVALNSKNNNGPNIQEEIYIPSNGDEKKPVKQVRVTPLTSRAVKVDWVEYSDRRDVVYHVYHNGKKTEVYCGNTTSKTINCTGLKPYTCYTVVVRRHGEDVNGTGKNKTKEEKPSPPTDITGSPAEDNTTDLFLHWQIPEKVNGKILQYRIHYSPNRNLSFDQWEKLDCNGSAMVTRVRNLTPGTKYYFKMQVKNGAGWSDPSKAKMIMVPKDKGPTTADPPGNTNAQAAIGGELKDKTLWIVIAAVAGATLIAIIIISVILCKKRSGEGDSPRKARKPPPSYKAAVMANGSVKKKNKEEKPPDLWINHTENMEMKPMNPQPDVTNIPRSSREMKPLDEHPIDQIKLDHERCSFRKGSQDLEQDELPPPPLHLLDEDDEPSPIAIPNHSPHRPVVNYPRPITPDSGPKYPAYPLTSTPLRGNAVPRSESFDNSREPNSQTPLLRSHSDDIDHTPSNRPPMPIYAVPKPKTKPKPPLEDPAYKVPPPTKPKPSTGPADNIQLPPVGYSRPTGGYRVPSEIPTPPPEYDEDYVPQRKDTRAVAAELDNELAGLEGLMKDLNEITTVDYLT